MSFLNIKFNSSSYVHTVCPQIYCDMTIDEGGWTLVWQHTYMKYKPLNPIMYYYSKSYRSCVKMLLMKIGAMFLIKLASTPVNR